MDNVVQMRRDANQIVANKQKKQSLFKQALNELQRDTGIDYYKVITGDIDENVRLKFKRQQEKLQEG